MKASKWITLLALVVLLGSLTPMARAEETTEPTGETIEETTEETIEETVEETRPKKVSKATSGTCGEDLTWEISGSTLFITGSGAMDAGCPWEGHKEKIKTVILDGVTIVGAEAFDGFEKLTGVNFGSSLKEIGEGAFRGCTALKEISLPATFRIFGVESFYGCTDLEAVYCAGGMPSFKGNCLWNGNYVTIYYPVNNPWPQEAVEVLMSNFGGRLTVTAATSDVPKPAQVENTRETTVATEAATEATEAVTEAPTEAATVPVVTVPVTEAPTEAAVQETETAAPSEHYTLPTMATEPQREAPEKGGLGGGVVAIALIAGVLTFFILGALIAQIAKRKGGKYQD